MVKVRALAHKIGYPDKWTAHETLEIRRDSFFTSYLNLLAYGQAFQTARIGKPVDKTGWTSSALEVNAYYEPTSNEIYFMAGHLQPPFFHEDASVPVNFGTAGAVMGHELVHGFDNTGRLYDAHGNLRDGWTPASNQAFLERAACVQKQFDGYTAVDDLKVNGTFTLAENLADLGGVKLAHAALEAWLAREPELARQRERYRFTPAQQLFIGAAQARCTKVRDTYQRKLVTVVVPVRKVTCSSRREDASPGRSPHRRYRRPSACPGRRP